MLFSFVFFFFLRLRYAATPTFDTPPRFAATITLPPPITPRQHYAAAVDVFFAIIAFAATPATLFCRYVATIT